MPATSANEKSTERIITLLPPSLRDQVATDAARRMLSVSAVVREILALHYRNDTKREPAT
jgi:hypothetical protein